MSACQGCQGSCVSKAPNEARASPTHPHRGPADHVEALRVPPVPEAQHRTRKAGQTPRGNTTRAEAVSPWERRERGGLYYTKSRKVNGRVIREYVGMGPLAELAAEVDAEGRRQREERAQ